jgi:hypothetical protein
LVAVLLSKALAMPSVGRFSPLALIVPVPSSVVSERPETLTAKESKTTQADTITFFNIKTTLKILSQHNN